jgi:hypothetical protein
MLTAAEVLTALLNRGMNKTAESLIGLYVELFAV